MSKKKEKEEELKESSNPFNKEMEVENTTSDNTEETETVSDSDSTMQNNNDGFKEKYEQLNNQYVRLAADFDNFRKRQAQERENLLKYGAEETLKKLIEVLDNFDRAQKAIENIDDCQQVKDSYNLVCNQMKDTLKKLGLEVIETEGKEFNPNFHEAVMQTPTSEYEEGIIITELQKGYKIGDKVLRAALVNVATTE